MATLTGARAVLAATVESICGRALTNADDAGPDTIAQSPNRPIAQSPKLRPRGGDERVRMAAPVGPSVFPA